MNTIKIVITKEDIYGRLFATSAYTARAREAIGTPTGITERMQLTADDKAIIDPMIDSSINEILCYISRYHPGSSVENNDNSEYRFCIPTPANYHTGNADKLAGSIKSYITNLTLQNWYTGIKPDEANIATAKAQNDAITIQAMLTQRAKPTRTTDNA